MLARRHAATASRAARHLVRSADTPAETALAAGPLALAQALPASLTGREQLLALLSSIADDVPEAVRPTIAAVIAALSGGAAPEVGSLTEALGSGNLPAAIGDIVEKALALAQTAVTHALDLVGGVLPSFLDGIGGLIQQLLGIRPV